MKMQVRFKKSKKIGSWCWKAALSGKGLDGKAGAKKENFSSSLLKSESMEQDNVVFNVVQAAVLC